MSWTSNVDDFRVVLCTVPNMPVAETIARAVVGDGLAACANIVPAIRSIYRWKGELCDDAELLLVIKTSRDACEPLMRRIVSEHPYETPEVIALPLSGGSVPYLEWLRLETKG